MEYKYNYSFFLNVIARSMMFIAIFCSKSSQLSVHVIIDDQFKCLEQESVSELNYLLES